jgi:hypothetical protein
MDQIIKLYENKVIELLEAKKLGYITENDSVYSLCNFVNNILDTLDESNRTIAYNAIIDYNIKIKLMRNRLCRP